jgi:bacillolysin
MKKICLSLLGLSLFCLSIESVLGQNAFDAKKRKNTSASTASLHARKIEAPSRGSSAARSSKSTFQSSRIPALAPQSKLHEVLGVNEGHPVFIETNRNSSSSRALVRKDMTTGAYDYLQEISPLLQMENVRESFIIQRTKYDAINASHIRMIQHYKGVPVHGAEVIVHLNSFGEGVAFNGKYVIPEYEIDVVPSVEKETAIAKIKADAFKHTSARLTDFERHLVEYAEPEATLCVYEEKGLLTSHVLAYHIMYSPAIDKRMEYFVDAHTGNVLKQTNTVCFVDGPKTATANDLNGVSRQVNTYQIGGNYFMLDASRAMYTAATSVLPDAPVGGILTVDMKSTHGDNAAVTHIATTNNAWTSATYAKAISAHYNAGKAYEYFVTKHGRNSINGKGGTILSLINVADPENGQPLDNAFWNGYGMYYGNGNVLYKPLAGGLDVAGHEMTHGVIQNTANLEYEGESGAINESLADIFGSMIDPDDWTIGEDVVKTVSFPTGALRSFVDPHNGGTAVGQKGYQPKHTSEQYTGTLDNGGVHINSGITNHAFYKYATAIGREKAAAIYYKALDDYLTKSSKFIDLRLAVVKAAGDLHGANSTEVTQAGLAFDAVGIGNGQGGDYEEELPENKGSEFLLVYNTNPGNANTLYRAPVSLASTTPLTTTGVISRPSVTDDGSVAVFVAADKTIHAIVIKPGSDPDEYVVQDEKIWSNVAISKDGNRMAAVTENADNTIYIYDFEGETWGEFELYNPTYSDGINSGGTEYADALEWDYTGEFVVYDAFNSIENTDGNDLEYWDVNFMHVWDLEGKDFGDGIVEKLFASLPEGVSIGNPTFAKLSPDILAFDMMVEATGEYYVLGSNVETGETDIIFENETLGYPSFNKNDTRVAFTLKDGSNYETGYVTLNADKISSPNTNAAQLLETTKWAVYFAVGSREDEVTGVEPEERTVSLICYPNPFVSEISMDLTNDFAGGGQVILTNMMGQPIYSVIAEKPGDAINFKFDNLPAGQYILRVKSGNKTGTCRAVKVN